MTGQFRRFLARVALGVAVVCGPAAHAADEGRLLASNCFQCHGTAGRGGAFDALAGETRKEILEELNEMQRENPRSSIMNAHARGYTPAQLNLLAAYFARLPKP